MRGLRSIFRKSDARQVGQYWDEVVRRAPATPMPHTDAAADAGETIRQIHGLEDRTPRHAPFADRQLQILLARHQEMTEMSTHSLAATSQWPGSPNTRTDRAKRIAGVQPSRRGWAPILSGVSAMALIATLAFTLAIAANLVQRGNDQPAIFAPSSPSATGSPQSSATAQLLWSYTGEGKMKLSSPPSVSIAPDGNIWVIDGGNQRIQVLTPDGTLKETWGAGGAGGGQFKFGYASTDSGQIAFASDGGFYAGESANARVQRFNKDRVFVSSWSGASTPNRTFGSLTGVSLDKDGNVWVPDNASLTVSKFTPEGKYLLTVGGYGQDPGQLEAAGTVAFDPDGHMLVADGRGSIQVFDLDGKYLRSIPLKDANGHPIAADFGVSTDAAGNMYLPGRDSKAAYVFDSSGRLLLTWTGTTAMNDPWNVVPDENGNMYVVDHGASVIYKVQIELQGSK